MLLCLSAIPVVYGDILKEKTDDCKSKSMETELD